MDIVLTIAVGGILVPLYNRIKRGLGLSDQSAVWFLMALSLLIGLPIVIATGELGWSQWNWTNPPELLRHLGEAFLVLLGTAETLYALTKKRIGG